VDADGGLRISQAASSRVSGDGGGNRSPLLLPGTADSGFLGMAASASSMALLGFPHGAGGTRGGEASVASRDRESRDPKSRDEGSCALQESERERGGGRGKGRGRAEQRTPLSRDSASAWSVALGHVAPITRQQTRDRRASVKEATR
jgi:hypothetical protein